MNERRRTDHALPLDEVLGIVERRRRRRARTRALAAPALSVAAVGVAGLVVAAVQAGSDAPPALTPAASPPGSTTSARPDLPTTPAPAPSAPPAGPVLPVDAGWLEADFLPLVGQYAVEDPGLATDAEELAGTWEIPDELGARAIVVKADWNGVPVDPADPTGDDALADRFAEAGYTAASAAELAAAWGTDTRTAEVMGGLLVEAGAFPPAG